MPISPAQAKEFRDSQLALKRAQYVLERQGGEDAAVVESFLKARDRRAAAERAADVASGRRPA